MSINLGKTHTINVLSPSIDCFDQVPTSIDLGKTVTINVLSPSIDCFDQAPTSISSPACDATTMGGGWLIVQKNLPHKSKIFSTATHENYLAGFTGNEDAANDDDDDDDDDDDADAVGRDETLNRDIPGALLERYVVTPKGGNILTSASPLIRPLVTSNG